MKNKIVVIIPARKGSKRIKNKNTRLLNGKPLIEWTIAAAKKSKFVNEIYITTNDEKVKIIAKNNKIKIINRPRHLANSFIMPDYAIKHAYLQIKKDFDYIILNKEIEKYTDYKKIGGKKTRKHKNKKLKKTKKYKKRR